MYAYSCVDHQKSNELLKGSVICDFDLKNNRYAWVNEMTSHLKSSETYADTDNLDDS